MLHGVWLLDSQLQDYIIRLRRLFMVSETENRIAVFPKQCPICGIPTVKANSVSGNEDLSDPMLWYTCHCGVLFQSECPEFVTRDSSYNDRFYALKEYESVGVHLAKTYSPIIEEMTLGRKMLDVGFGTGESMKFFKKRGWVSFGMETNIDTIETDRIFKDNFETTDKLYKDTYDLVWMGYLLHKLKDPKAALVKAKEILHEGGVLFISTADIDFLYSKPSGQWLYWNKENYIMWSKRALVRELERLGFEVVLQRRNYSSRYGYYFDFHIIAQVKYF